MCGIVGVIGNLTKKEMTAFEQLLFIDTLRGEDSTGIVCVDYLDKPSFFKKAYPAQDFLDMGQARSLLTKGKVLIGHNRWATKGAVNHVNAHPFQHGHITGVHNGTLRDQKKLPDHKDFPVDSDNIYHSIAKVGEEETVKNLNGAFALVWYDEKDKKVKIIRNSERPLYYTFTEGSKQMFFASEDWMLMGILHRNGVKHGKILRFKEDHLYSFSMPEKGVVPGANIRKLVTYKPPVHNVASFPHNRAVQANFKFVGDFLGKYMNFRVGGTYKDKYGNDYLSLQAEKILSVGKDTYLTRCYTKEVFPLLEEARERGVEVKARFKDSLPYPSAPYITIVSDSISFIEPAKGKEKEVSKDAPFHFKYEGYNGTMLTEKQWLKSTSKGCAWCASPPNKDEKLVWLSHNEFVCSDCAEFSEVKQYLV